MAYADGRPVATGTVVLTHGVSYLGWIATVPDHGRGGLGSMVTAWLVARGDELGGRGSVLLASRWARRSTDGSGSSTWAA